MSRLIITGVRPLGDDAVDIVVDGQTIVEINPSGSTDTADSRVLDGDGLIALPGLVDLHTHLREPGREDAETVETGT